VGAVVGIVAVGILGLMIFLYRRRRHREAKSPSWKVDHTPPATPITSRERAFVPPAIVRAKTSTITHDMNTASYTLTPRSGMYEGANPSSELTTSSGTSNSPSSQTLAVHRESVKPVARPKRRVDDPPPRYVP
jgi:hypothetical protein